MDKRRILIIAGSDSSGGAGLEADQKVIAYHNCYAMTATTALTAQNTLGVRRIHTIPPDFLAEQLNAVMEDVGVDVIKIGMLASAATVEAVASALLHFYPTHPPPMVLDPVMVATSGTHLLSPDAASNLVKQLLSFSTVLTPNIPEAKLLLESAGSAVPEITSVDDMVDIAGRIQRLGPKYVLVKGGHMPLTRDGRRPASDAAEDQVIMNVLHDGSRATVLEMEYVRSPNTHGTGCSLASAIAAQMALRPQADMIEHVTAACQYIERGIRASVSMKLGQGSGPINHFPDAEYKTSAGVRDFAVNKHEA